MVLEILTLPDKRLKIQAKKIAIFDQDLQKLADDMIETMYHDNGIGLAGTQVDKHIQIFVADVSKDSNEPQVFINPEIISKQGEREYEEGCLSVPEYRAKIVRADKIILNYQNINGKEITAEFDGLLATCIQHEIDHLQGKLFIDYLSKLKQKRVLEKLKKLKMHRL
jgi:peptide deformylase